MTFRIGVIGAFAPGEHVALSSRTWKEPVRFSRDDFDVAMAKVAPELAIDVPDPHDPRGKPVRIDLHFAKLRAFQSDQIAASVPLLKSLHADDPKDKSVAASGASGTSGSSLLDSLLGDEASARLTISDVNHPFDATLSHVIENANVKKLARAWRGLAFVVSHSSADVTVDAIAAEADEVDAAITRLFTGEEPLGLLIVDHAVTSSQRDLARLSEWALRAEAEGVPVVVNGTPELLGFDEIEKLARTERRIQSSDDPRAAALRNIAAKDSTRWVMLALNGGDEVSAASFVGALVAKSFARVGWPCAIIGPHDGKLTDLPLFTSSIPLEALIPEAVAKDAASAGVALFECAKNADVCVLTRAPMLHRGAVNASGGSPASTATLSEQLFLARVSQAILQLAAAIPQDAPVATVKEVALLALTELCGAISPRTPEFEIAVSNGLLEVTVRPRGAFGMRVDEVTLGARLG